MVTAPPSGVNLRALESRLVIMRSICTRSTSAEHSGGSWAVRRTPAASAGIWNWSTRSSTTSQRVRGDFRSALDLHAIDLGGALGRQLGGEAHAGGFGGDLELVDQVIDHFAEVEARFLEYDLARLGLGEQQQGAHDLAEAIDIGEGVEHGLAVLIGGLGGEESHLELAADGGDGGAQFVGDVGGELAHLLEAGFQALDHAVEGEDEVIELVGGAARGNAHAEIGAGDALRGLRHGEHRSEEHTS